MHAPASNSALHLLLKGLLGAAAFVIGILAAPPLASAAPPATFPADFPALIASGGPAAGRLLTGWGGLAGQPAAAQRAALRHRPVILLHGNGGNADHPLWGMGPLHDALVQAGYNDAEIWAVSYLGAANDAADMPTPYTDNIDDVRRFIDAVRGYLGVQQVDVIGHSLGAGLAKGYIDGLQPDGSRPGAARGHANIGTFVSLGGAHYGLGYLVAGELQTGGWYESASHFVDGVADDTPHGAPLAFQSGAYPTATALDDGGIVYAALWSVGDCVDAQDPNTGHLAGANLNQPLVLGFGLTGHAALITDPSVFAVFAPYLNRGIR